MTLRDLITELEDIARRAGDRLDVEIITAVAYEDGEDEYRELVRDVVYQGGGVVELRT